MNVSTLMTRRGFVAALAILGSTTAVGFSGCSPHEENNVPQVSEAELYDAVIVGGGLTGMMAAITLNSVAPDKKVLLLEGQEALGGSVKYSDGVFVGFSDKYDTDPTDCATAEQMYDMIDRAANAVVDAGYAAMDSPLDKDFIESIFGELPETINDLIEMGVPFDRTLDLSSPYARGEYSDSIYGVGTEGLGAGFADAVIACLEKTKVEVRLNAQVEDLIVDGDAVTGVTVSSEGKSYEVKTPAVLLATGGFAASPEKLEEYLQPFSACEFYPNPGALGSAIDFTRRFDTPLVSNGVFGGVNSADDTFTITACHFLVNQEGRRFTNEDQNWYILLWPVVENTSNASGWCICDASYVEENPEETGFKIEAGTLVSYSTLEELCSATGIDQQNLEETVKSYNDAVDAGIDPEFGLPVASAHPVKTPPFYAEQTTTWCFGTIKGLQTDNQCRVLTGAGEAVPGLYAAGEVASGNVFFGQYPSGGSGNSLAANSGRFVGGILGK